MCLKEQMGAQPNTLRAKIEFVLRLNETNVAVF